MMIEDLVGDLPRRRTLRGDRRRAAV